MLAAGLQEPLIPLPEVIGSINEFPEQIAGICVKVGAIELVLTVTVMEAVEAAHCPAAGVNV